MRARYGELRDEYFGLGAFNFGPESLEAVAQQRGSTDPEGAMTAIELNLEHHPESFTSWLLKGQLHALDDETEAAIEAFERSLEIAPGNPVATEQLARLRESSGG